MTTATAGLSTKERLEKLLAALGPLDGKQFTGLTGKTLRSLIDEGVVAPQFDETGVDVSDRVFHLDAPEIFKGVNDQKALAFMEANPRAQAKGYLNKDDATIIIDMVYLGLKNDENGYPSLAHSSDPALTKKQIVGFANTFFHADEFQIGDTFAYAWFD